VREKDWIPERKNGKREGGRGGKRDLLITVGVWV